MCLCDNIMCNKKVLKEMEETSNNNIKITSNGCHSGYHLFNYKHHQHKQHHHHHHHHHHNNGHHHSWYSSMIFSLPSFLCWLTLIFVVGQLKIVVADSTNMPEPIFISRSETYKFVAGDTLKLPCEVSNAGSYVVAWKRGIAILSAGKVIVKPDPRIQLFNGYSLQVNDVNINDAGDYTCQIATMIPREITHMVEILVPPRIHHISSGGHMQVKKGNPVRIECSASGNPTPNITWTRKNNVLPNGSKMTVPSLIIRKKKMESIGKEGDEKLLSNVLEIDNMDRHKGGIYICTATNGVGHAASGQVVLHVLYAPEIAVETPVVFTGEGQEALLVCIVHGEAQPEVVWFKETMQLDTTERHITENRGSRHTLIIRKVHPQDFGNYLCVAENQLGKTKKTLQLTGKPNTAIFRSPPVSQYKDKYNISWTVDSHTPIEEFKLYYRRMPEVPEIENNIESQPLQHQPTQSHRYNNYWPRNDWRDVVLPAVPLSHHYTQGMSYMIRNLEPDRQYEAKVEAKNRFGWGAMSESFTFSTSINDSEMRDLSVTYYGSSTATKNVSIYLGFSLILTITITILFV